MKIDDSLTRDDTFALHIGADRIFAGNAFLTVVNSNNVVVSQILRTDTANERDPAVQLHVTATRAWVKDLRVVTTLTAPEITALETRASALENRAAAIEVLDHVQQSEIDLVETEITSLK